MYVTPQTNLKVYRNIPWNNDYKHTRWFSTVAQQITYFAGKIAYTFQSFTYVRQSGVIRVPMIADNLYNCNYISFQNESYGNKVFYAFITKVEYVNNETTHIYFDIDHVQSWMFQYQLEQCFVEREHVSDDTVGLHTVDENLDTGEYLIESEQKKTHDNFGILFVSANKYVPESPAEVRYSGNVPELTQIYGVQESAVPAFIGDVLQYYFEKPEAVGSLRIIPNEMCATNYGRVQAFSNTDLTLTRAQSVVFKTPNTNKTYTPKNNKLKCFPYCALTMDNFCGDVVQLRWEEFADPFSINFIERGTPNPTPCMELSPMRYKKNYNQAGSTRQFTIKFNNFPEICFPSDNFKLWSSSQFKKDIASEGASIITKSFGVGAMAGTMASPAFGVTAGVASAIVNTAKATYDLKVDYEYHKIHAYSLSGSAGDSSLLYNDHEVGFRITSYQIRAEYAEIIDNFLTRFGYKVNVIKVPNTNSRRYFNFVKTIDASIRGNVPNEAQKVICAVFDAGVTLWHTDDVGNYNVDNAIVG